MLCTRRPFAPSGLFTAVLLSSLLAVCGVSVAKAQGLNAAHNVRSPESRVMSLEPLSVEERAAQNLLKNPKTLREVPEGFREFGRARAGQVVETKSLTLRFAAAASLTKIEGTPDFKVEQGGSCVEAYSYAANSSCTLLVRFTPQGPGRRVGKLAVTNSAEVAPLLVGLGGDGDSPAISFTPSIITTVPGTYVSGAGIVSGATNLAVDGGDNLYIADTGNNKIDYIDSSGVIQNLTASIGATAPIAVAADGTGAYYFTEDTQYFFLSVIQDAYDFNRYETGSNYCAYGSTCPVEDADLTTQYLGAFAVDPAGNIFLNTASSVARLVPTSGLNYIPLSTYFNYDANYPNAPLPLAVDSSDNLYTYYSIGIGCTIFGTSYYDAETNTGTGTAVAGGKTCGFSGDGGQARGAEIGKLVGQMTFDLAGNLYFSDTLNQRVRRVDNLTGIITTIAGNGATGYAGDGGPATSAQLNTPAGVAVDSQGQVYILSSSSTTGAAQVVRKVGTVGALYLGGMTVGSSSTAQTVTVANTGNANLDVSRVAFTSGNTTDFVMDPTTTNCVFTVPLASGRSCKIGFIFSPSAAGGRSAVLSLTDDTVAGLNTIQVSGTGYTTATLTPASFTFASTVVGSSTATQTATLTNTGKVAMTISSIGITGAAASSFTDSTNCGITLAVGASCTIAVSFKPAAGGTLSAALTVNDNAITGSQSVALGGTGVAAVLSPTSLTFPATQLGATSAPQTVKLTNMATVPITFDSYYYHTDFPTTDNCPTTIAAGASCTVTIKYQPAALGARATSLTVNTSTGGVTVALNGTGVAAVLSPTSLTFPSTAVGATSATQTIKLTNTAATALSVGSYSVTTDFPTTENCPASLAAGASCTFIISFKPATASVRAVVLTIYTTNGAVTATLNGTGTAAAVKKTSVTLIPVRGAMVNDPTGVVLNARVNGDSSVLPTGSVQLWEGKHMWAETQLIAGLARFEMESLPSGVHTMNAVYPGDNTDSGSRSAMVTVTVGSSVDYPSRR